MPHNILTGVDSIDDSKLLNRLTRPGKRVNVILDTDAFNEVDDQFALSYMIHSPENFNVKGIFAAPFFNEKSESPADGMEKSYNEIINLLTLSGRDDLKSLVHRGSADYLSNGRTPVDSDAARQLIALAEAADNEPLYVVAIGAITNVASALIINPEIKEKIVIVWLGGHSYHWKDTREFNMHQDIAAARVVFDSGTPVIQLPCHGIVSHLTTTEPELRHWLKDKNKLCDYLYTLTKNDTEAYHKGEAWSRVIWDISAIAWFISDSFTAGYITHSPVVTYDGRYSFDNTRPFIRYINWVNRDGIFTDLFKKITVDLSRNMK